MDLPPSAAPRRRAPRQGRLCGRSPASSDRRRVASLVAVPAGAPVSVARPRPRPKCPPPTARESRRSDYPCPRNPKRRNRRNLGPADRTAHCDRRVLRRSSEGGQVDPGTEGATSGGDSVLHGPIVGRVGRVDGAPVQHDPLGPAAVNGPAARSSGRTISAPVLISLTAWPMSVIATPPSKRSRVHRRAALQGTPRGRESGCRVSKQ